MLISVKDNTLNLLVERLFKGFNFSRLIDWARVMLDSGNYAESLIILANMENGANDELEKYFLRSIEELDLNVPEDIESQLQSYADGIARKVLEGEISQDYGFMQMLKVAKVTNKDFRYIGFQEIEEDLDNLYYGRKTKRSSLTLENQADYIREEFKLFSAMESLEVSMEDRKQEYCMVCGKLTQPVTKTKYQISRPFRYYALCCEHCKSERLKPASEHFVKKKILQLHLGKSA